MKLGCIEVKGMTNKKAVLNHVDFVEEVISHVLGLPAKDFLPVNYYFLPGKEFTR
jgi:hypothetical protein